MYTRIPEMQLNQVSLSGCVWVGGHYMPIAQADLKPYY